MNLTELLSTSSPSRPWLGISLALLFTTGCASPFRIISDRQWVADYDAAERRMSETDRDLLIFYVDDRPGRGGGMDDIIKSPTVRELGERHVCCTLVKSFEPDRRFVAQYGVERAPALVRVHRDGTYHATASVFSAADVMRFVDASVPPGTLPIENPYIPRRAPYQWLDSLKKARDVARQTGLPMLVLVYRSWSRDWNHLEDLLAPHEVYSRLSPMVHVRDPRSRFFGNKSSTPFGNLQLPALVIVDTNGTFTVLELPTSTEAIVRFADSVLGDPVLDQTGATEGHAEQSGSSSQ